LCFAFVVTGNAQSR